MSLSANLAEASVSAFAEDAIRFRAVSVQFRPYPQRVWRIDGLGIVWRLEVGHQERRGTEINIFFRALQHTHTYTLRSLRSSRFPGPRSLCMIDFSLSSAKMG